MGFRTFVARGLLVAFFIVSGVSMVSNPVGYEGVLRNGLERASSKMHLVTGLSLNPSFILANSKSAISVTGGALLGTGVLTILGVKFAAFIMMAFISVGASIFYNPLLTSTEAEGKLAMINLLKSLAVIGGLLIVLYGTPEPEQLAVQGKQAVRKVAETKPQAAQPQGGRSAKKGKPKRE